MALFVLSGAPGGIKPGFYRWPDDRARPRGTSSWLLRGHAGVLTRSLVEDAEVRCHPVTVGSQWEIVSSI